MEYQNTIAKDVVYKGIGLHTGNMCKAIFRPAPPDNGITFVRLDLPGKPKVPANFKYVENVVRGTTLRLDDSDVAVHTVEHIMAALYGTGIDNAIIELTNNEPPVGDGSALPFVEILENAGVLKQNAPKNYFTVKETIEYTQGIARITAVESGHLEIFCSIEYNHPLIPKQEADFVITPETFKREIAPARTFCFDYEIEALKKNGLAKGGTLENAVVIGLDKIHVKGKLRFSDEFVRHKILDFIGDMYLLGKPIKAKISASKCGHGHNINFLKLLCSQQSVVGSR